MNTATKAAKIVSTYHHESHRFADGLVDIQTARGAYHRAMLNACEGLALAEIGQMLDVFGALFDAHAPSCPICSQKGL
jgi:hypothetical protein